MASDGSSPSGSPLVCGDTPVLLPSCGPPQGCFCHEGSAVLAAQGLSGTRRGTGKATALERAARGRACVTLGDTLGGIKSEALWGPPRRPRGIGAPWPKPQGVSSAWVGVTPSGAPVPSRVPGWVSPRPALAAWLSYCQGATRAASRAPPGGVLLQSLGEAGVVGHVRGCF